MSSETKAERIIIWDDIAMMILALISAYLLVLEFTTDLTSDQIVWINRIDIFIACIFLAEFLIKYYLSTARRSFLIKNWWYLLASIPVISPGTQLLRFLRLFRLVRLFRLHVGIREIFNYLENLIEETRLAYVFTIWCAIVCAGTLSFFVFEHAVNPTVQTMFDSLWYVISTITTVGYGDVYPHTAAGRVIGMLLMLSGIGTTGVFMALVSSFLIRNKKG